MSAAEQVVRLSEAVSAARAQWYADLLLRNVHALPGTVVQGLGGTPAQFGAAGAALYEVETGLALAVRLGLLRQNQINTVLALLDDLHQELRAAGPAPASRPAAAAAPAPLPPPAAVTPRVLPTPIVVETEAATARPRSAEPAQVPAPPAQLDYLLVDGCNFLGRAQGYELGDESSRDRLLFRLQEYAREHPAHHVVVVFDGKRASSRVTAGVEERVTSGLHSADDVMVDYLRTLSREDRRRTTVVTDDRDLAARVRREGVKAESVPWLVSRFVRRQTGAGQKPGISRSELSEWENYFSQPPKRPGKQ
ncbi:MAG: YacP-like domain [Armatimonadetes bacterium]|nr:YacP-like domain [Armatimonadota bacterium]